MLKQVSIYAENKKGAMQNITSMLADSGINILGSVTNDSAEFGIVRMISTEPERAKEILVANGYLAKLSNVLGVEVADEVGNLNKLLMALQESNINVNYIYLSFNRESAKPVMVFHTDDCEGVEQCLKAKGFRMTEV
ncbi:MAG: amino acid-binding protein [Lachnospiraceae bacterium]|nr:amino acid-binding protein [Lachnospiraceae bacterium]